MELLGGTRCRTRRGHGPAAARTSGAVAAIAAARRRRYPQTWQLRRGSRMDCAGILAAVSRRLGAKRESQHDEPKHQERESPPQIHVHPERFLVDGGVRDQAVDDEYRADDREHTANREPHVETHSAITRR